MMSEPAHVKQPARFSRNMMVRCDSDARVALLRMLWRAYDTVRTTGRRVELDESERFRRLPGLPRLR